MHAHHEDSIRPTALGVGGIVGRLAHATHRAQPFSTFAE